MHKGSNPIFVTKKNEYITGIGHTFGEVYYTFYTPNHMFIYYININKHFFSVFSLLLVDLLLCFVAVSEYHGCRLSVTATAGGQGLPMLAVIISSNKNKSSILICGVSPRWWLFTNHLKNMPKSQIGNQNIPKVREKNKKWNHHLEPKLQNMQKRSKHCFTFAMFF